MVFLSGDETKETFVSTFRKTGVLNSPGFCSSSRTASDEKQQKRFRPADPDQPP